MRKILLFTLLCIFRSAIAQTYISNVTVIDVEKQMKLPDQTLIINNGIIDRISSSSSFKIPANAQVINGKGKFLMPGLVDAHVHFFQSGGLYARPDAIDLRKYRPYEQEILWTKSNITDFLNRYLTVGITTVIDPGSTNNFLKKRDSVSDKLFPSIYMSGPLITTYAPEEYKGLKDDEPFKLVASIEEGKAAVLKQLQYRPDFIKIWYIVDDKNIAEAQENSNQS